MNYQQYLDSIGATLEIMQVNTGMYEWVSTGEAALTSVYNCVLRRGEQASIFTFYGRDVDVETVMENMADLFDLSRKSFEDWRQTFGDDDPIANNRELYCEAIYQTEQFRRVLGEHFEQFCSLDPYRGEE